VKRRVPIHLKAILILVVAIAIYSGVVPLVSAAIPGQLYRWYLATTIVVILLYVSSSEASWVEFVTPFRELLLGRTVLTKPLRMLVFIALPLLLGWYFSSWAAGSVEPPGGLRVIHPTPPQSVTVQGKRMVLKEVTVNPLRNDEKRVLEHIEQGRMVYYKNCFFCHGDNLQGEGHFAKGFNPPPANFQDPGTIAQLSESFLFWRIAKGIDAMGFGHARVGELSQRYRDLAGHPLPVQQNRVQSARYGRGEWRWALGTRGAWARRVVCQGGRAGCGWRCG
jgi:hypothetical protein